MQLHCSSAGSQPVFCTVEDLFWVTLAWEELKMVLLLQMTPQNCSSPGPEAHTRTHRRNTHQSRERLSSQTEVWHLLYPAGPCWSHRHLDTVSVQLWEAGQLNTALRSRSGGLKWAFPGIMRESYRWQILHANLFEKDFSLKIGDRLYDSAFNPE